MGCVCVNKVKLDEAPTDDKSKEHTLLEIGRVSEVAKKYAVMKTWTDQAAVVNSRTNVAIEIKKVEW